MSIRRAVILLLFFLIGVVAVFRTLLLIQSVIQQHGGCQGENGTEEEKGICGFPRNRLRLIAAAVPFLITSLVLFLHTLQKE